MNIYKVRFSLSSRELTFIARDVQRCLNKAIEYSRQNLNETPITSINFYDKVR